jgi:phage I-like protein
MTTTLRGASASLRAQATESKAWNLVFPRGQWHGPNLGAIGGSIDIDDAMLREMVANWEAAGRPALPVRVTHAHLDEADPVKRLELERAVGLLTDMRVTADGLEVLTEWAPAGVEAVRSGAWNFWSPEWQPQHRDRRTGEARGWWLSGVALTNDPFFNSMPAVAASTALPPGSPTGTPHKEQLMSYAKIAAALGMPEDSTEEAIVAECMKMKGGMQQMQPPGMMQASVKAEVSKAVEPLQASLKAATEKAAALEAALFDRDVDAVIESAKAEGYACEPMREAIKLVASAHGLDAAKKLAQSAQKLAMKPAGVSTEKKLTASTDEYVAALTEHEKKTGLKGREAIQSFHRANPEMARVMVASIPTTATR